MNDNNNFRDKKVKNPLFSASVTGGTFEDFTQNAVLLPAQVISPPVVSQEPKVEERTDAQFSVVEGNNLTFQEIHPNTASEISPAIGVQSNQYQPINFNYFTPSNEAITANNSQLGYTPATNTAQEQSQGHSHFSSVFSTFSKVLNFNSPSAVKSAIQPPPSSIENLIGLGDPSSQPVPLFTPGDINLNVPAPTDFNQPTNILNQPTVTNWNQTSLQPLNQPPIHNLNQPPIQNLNQLSTGNLNHPPPGNASQPLAANFGTSNPPQGPANTYRRIGAKRLTYAPVPGLTSSSSRTTPPQTHSAFHANQTNTPPFSKPQVPCYFQPELPIQEEANSASPVPLFTPQRNSPLTISSNIPSPYIRSGTPSIDSVSATPFLQPITSVDEISIKSNTSSILSPVMSSVPFSNVPQNSDIPTMPCQSYNAQNMGNPLQNTILENNTSNQIYRPPYHHWFHKKEVETKVIWTPFSMADSLSLESAFTSTDVSPDDVVATDGGRYDVNILRRQRLPVYWKGEANEVRRCSWFHKVNDDSKYKPYEENVAAKLEEEYKIAFETSQWNRKVELANGDTVVFHGPDVLVVFPPSPGPDTWGNTPVQPRPMLVKRGVDEFDIDEGESPIIDHLLFLVHGIGSVCDLKFRTVEEVVDEFRSISLQLVRSHYRSSCEKGLANRIEVLPISWHSQLHSEDTGIDNTLKSITLESIPRLRDFTNDTLLDILFYTSPVYCQTIISTVGNELNRIYDLFKQRNPSFTGSVYVGGHSLGSLILFDLLCHQYPEPEKEEPVEGDEDVVTPLKPHPIQRRMSRRISYMMSNIGTGQAQLSYPHLTFQPVTFFALGSPIGMFVTVRGLDTLGEKFALPTCQGFFNIFHPYDPVAYRVEALINPQLSSLKPVLIPHHKGRKRMHLELKETMARVGADLKQKVIDSMKNTWNSFYQFAVGTSNPPNLEEQVNKVLEVELQKQQEKCDEEDNSTPENQQTDLSLGLLNKGRRVDYVLQEAPFEFFNEYIFALTSHVCYWESEDTMLLILKEIYTSMGLQTDSQIPQQTMTIERPPPSPNSLRAEAARKTPGLGMDPTMPITSRSDLQPPPTSGFIRKS